MICLKFCLKVRQVWVDFEPFASIIVLPNKAMEETPQEARGETMSINEEIILIARAKEGDLAAFEALYEMHKASIYRTGLAITNDRSVAEEILQDTFLRAFKHIDRVYEDVSLAPWLYRIAVNLAYDWTIKHKRWLAALNDIVDRFVMPTSPLPERSVEERELQDLLYEAVNRLEFKQRATLVLFYLQDFSLAEIAEIMECPVGTVKSRLHYARENLRQELLADERLPGGLIYEFT
jgi:RNA polymerase sigma-70 factor (ECF subfamily)